MSDEQTNEAKVVAPTINLKLGIVGTGIYLALGVLYHLIFGDYEVFTWNDPWLFVGMFLWPFLLFFRFIIVCAIIGVIALAAWFAFVEYPEQRQRKRVAAERKAAYEKERAERAERLEAARREAAKNA